MELPPEVERALAEPEAAELLGEALAFLPVPAALLSSELSLGDLERGLRNSALGPEARERVQALLAAKGYLPSDSVRRRSPPKARVRPPLMPVPPAPPPRVFPTLGAARAPGHLSLAERLEHDRALHRTRHGLSPEDAMIAACLEALQDPALDLTALHGSLVAFRYPAREAWLALARAPGMDSVLAEQILAGERSIQTAGEHARFIAACQGLLGNPVLPSALRKLALGKLEPLCAAQQLAPDAADPELALLLAEGAPIQQHAAVFSQFLPDPALVLLLASAQRIGGPGAQLTVAEAVLANPAVTTARVERLLRSGAKLTSRALEVLLERNDLEPSSLVSLATQYPHEGWGQRTGLPASVYQALIAAAPTRTFPLWDALAANDAVPEAVLRHLWQAPDLRRTIAARPNAAALLEEVAPTLDDPELDTVVLRHPGISDATRARVAERLASSVHTGARAAAARWPGLAAVLLRQLARDPERQVRLALATHAAGAEALVHAGAGSNQPLWRYLCRLDPRAHEIAPSETTPNEAAPFLRWKMRLEDRRHGLLRHHEGDSLFRVVAIERADPEACAVLALRSQGHLVEEPLGAFERALAGNVGAALLEILGRFSDPSDIALAGPIAHDPVTARHEVRSLWARPGEAPVARIVRVLDRWLAVVPPHDAEQKNVVIEPAPLVEAPAEGAFAALRAELEARAPPEVAPRGRMRRWGFGDGANPDQALEQALRQCGVLRRDAKPFRGFASLCGPSEDGARADRDYGRLDALLLQFANPARYIYGWCACYEELVLGSSPEGFLLGVAASISWT